MSQSPQSLRLWQLYFAVIGVGYFSWFALAYVHFAWFSSPTLDAWCYFAPAIFASAPMELHSPLLGNFADLNQAWGLHWPGVLWVHSIWLSLLPDAFALHTIYYLGIWSLVAAMLGLLVWRMTANAWLAALFFFIYLSDKGPFGNMHELRPELPMALIILVTTWGLLRLWREGEQAPRWLWGGLIILSFLLPLLHPMGCVIAAALGLFAAMQWWRGRLSFSYVAALAIAMFLGLLSVVAHFYFQPAAWEQFQDHREFNQVPFSWGGTLLKALLTFYSPLYVGFLFFGLGLAGLLYFLFWQGKALVGEPAQEDQQASLGEGAIVAWMAVFALLGAQFFHNEHYVMIALPLMLLLGAVLLQLWWKRMGTWLQVGLLVAVLGVATLNAAFWPSRTWNYVKLGTPQLRAELVEFYAGLPESPRIGIPIKLWQAAAIHPRSGVLMTTLPHHATRERREAYERYVGEQLQAGDLLVIDDKYGLQPTFRLAENLRLEPVARLDRRLQFRPNRVGGFDLQVYRLVDEAEASPAAILPPQPGGRRAPYTFDELGKDRS